jgi:hypothetical protein
MDSGPKHPRGVSPPDPKTGEPLDFADMREEFERLSRQTPRDPEAERAFIENKIEMIRTDRRMSPEEKDRAIAELRRGLTQEPGL